MSTHVVIIGNGVAGISCARHLRKRSSSTRITVISSETKHFFSRTALMYIYMGHMRYEHTKPYEDSFWRKNRIELLYDQVISIDTSKKKLALASQQLLNYDLLVLATGSCSRFLNWPGQTLKGVQGLYSYSDLLSMKQMTHGIRQAVVVGGGLIGIELIEMLHSVGISSTFLLRGQAFWEEVLPREEALLATRHIEKQGGIHIRRGLEIKSLEGDSSSRICSILCSDDSRIECQFAGIAIGVVPNLLLTKNTAIETDRGILVDDYLQTSVPDVYAIGDCAQLRDPLAHRRPIEAVWYVGRMMGETLAATLSGEKNSYRPGVWFNSAKFFDLEYQVYGHVPIRLSSTEESLYWAHPNGSASLRIVFDKLTAHVLGCNSLGLRQKHTQWAKWISQKTALPEVLSHLEEARFDAEFEYRYEPLIRQQAQKRDLFAKILS